jgi:hypothetical protein
MADEHKARRDPKADQVTQWLAENRQEFEGHGIAEDKLAQALNMTSEEITETIDHLEAREELVRIPRGVSTPPQFLLKPGRGWAEVRDEIGGNNRAATQKA